MTISNSITRQRWILPIMTLFLFFFNLLGSHFGALDYWHRLPLSILKTLAKPRSWTAIFIQKIFIFFVYGVVFWRIKIFELEMIQSQLLQHLKSHFSFSILHNRSPFFHLLLFFLNLVDLELLHSFLPFFFHLSSSFGVLFFFLCLLVTWFRKRPILELLLFLVHFCLQFMES